MVVVGADVFVLQKGEQFGFMTFESLNEPFDVLVTIVVDQKDLIKAIIQSTFQAIVFLKYCIDFTITKIFFCIVE